MPRRAITACSQTEETALQCRDIPFVVHWHEEPRLLAHALGLDVELPDINTDSPDFWDRFDHEGWRKSLPGKVDMSATEMAHEASDWIRLKRLGGTIEAWFDIEEGVVFDCRAAAIARTALIIRQLATTHRLSLWREGEPLVTATQTIVGHDIPSGMDLAQYLVPAGFEWQRRRWVLKGAGR